MLGREEQTRLLTEFNPEPRPVEAATIAGLFEEQAERTPDADAVVCGDQTLSYRELNHQANRLAHHLISLGLGPGSYAGIFLPRTAEMVVAMLAVLKSGAAYVPLDPAYPPLRLAEMVTDSAPVLIITTDHLKPALPGASGTLLIESSIWKTTCSSSAKNPDNKNRIAPLLPTHTAYLIYTSGSTGRPKGVMIQHQAVANFISWAAAQFGAELRSGVLFSTSISWDLSVFELWATLAQGGCVISTDSILELPTLEARDRIHLVNTVPSAIKALLDCGALPPHVRTVNLAGEALPNSVVQALYDARVGAVYNLYGPTESTTYATFTCCRKGAQDEPSIGNPVWNTRAYVLDSHLNHTPLGVVGELYISGTGLALGYLKRPAVTAERFVADPYGHPGGRMYRTGDLVRRRPDGQLDFLGRGDDQVKVRGYRIELGEIEAALHQHPFIHSAAVGAIEDRLGQKQLTAYFVPANGSAGNEDKDTVEELQLWLRDRLPDYMIPVRWVRLEALPLKPNGKLDRKNLLFLDVDEVDMNDAFVAPTTAVEQALAALWGQVLSRERISIHDDFFRAGGDSLRAIRLSGLISQVFQIDFPIRTLFEAKTLRHLSEVVEAALVAKVNGLSEAEVEILIQGELPTCQA
jgi:amino acid adenylation domain-containing protein